MTDENTNTPVNSPEKPKPKPESIKSPRITNSQKEKDPRKVAAGKKLGAISRMAKSQKKYKAGVQQASEVQANETENAKKFSFNMTVCVVAAVAVVGFVALGYFKTKTENNETPKPPTKTQNPNLISLE